MPELRMNECLDQSGRGNNKLAKQVLSPRLGISVASIDLPSSGTSNNL